VAVLVIATAGGAADGAGPQPAADGPTVTPARPARGKPGRRDAAQQEARRRWALARMDEVARDRQRCAERFRTPREVRECERPLERAYRRYNEAYLEASRE
jgi:hypothetical protein